MRALINTDGIARFFGSTLAGAAEAVVVVAVINRDNVARSLVQPTQVPPKL